MGVTYDFSGWATRNDLKCSDGRTIRRDAFKDCDGKIVPLVWNHQHNATENVLGYAMLENRPEGVYTYGTFNDTPAGREAKELVRHGDVSYLSIYANHLKQVGGDVLHGAIREVSLVLAGANPGALIDDVIVHSETQEGEAMIYTDEYIELAHAEEETETKDSESEDKGETLQDVVDTMTDKQKEAMYAIVGMALENNSEEKENKMENIQHADGEKTVQDVVDSMTEEQKNVLYYLVGEAAKENENEGETEEMKHNAFDANEEMQGNVLSHSDMEVIFSDAKRYGSLKDAVLAHGISDIEILFPDAHNMNGTPEFIKRQDDWVAKVMKGVHKTPFSRIKSVFANITEDEARAKGFLHDRTETYRDELGNLIDKKTGKPFFKKEEVFSLLKRTTTPTTVYKKQKLDRDDVLDITDFDVVAWIKKEMRMMLEEELARAILVGDGRLASDDDKINETNIRPILSDSALYTITKTFSMPADSDEYAAAKEFIRQAKKARKGYKGSGNPTVFMTEDMLTDCLLIEDLNGRVIYDTEEKLRTALRASEIVTVPVMEGMKVNTDFDLDAIFVNLDDYRVGADKGGEVNMFDDFDIDYNTQKYLIETRCSGALAKPYSAIVVGHKVEVA